MAKSHSLSKLESDVIFLDAKRVQEISIQYSIQYREFYQISWQYTV